MAQYEIYLRGSATYFAVTDVVGDDNTLWSFVETDASDAAPLKIEAPPASSWLEVPVLGASAELIADGEPSLGWGGERYASRFSRYKFTIETLPFSFPTEFSTYWAILQTLAQPYLFFKFKTYPLEVTNVIIPTEAEADVFAVDVEFSVTHNYDDGSKSITMTFFARSGGRQ